jgi:hypothetical protein
MKNLLLLVFTFLFFSFQILSAQSQNKHIETFLSSKVSLKKLAQKDISEYVITSQHKSSISNIEHIYFRQSIDGVSIVGTESSIHVYPDETLLRANFGFKKSITDKVIGAKTPKLSAKLAIQRVAQQMGYYQSGGLNALPKSTIPNSDYVFSGAGISEVNIPVKLVYVKLEQSKFVLAWELSIKETKSSDWYNFYADASTGKIISKNNWTVNCLKGHDHSTHNEIEKPKAFVSVKNKPTTKNSGLSQGTYNVFPLPVENPFSDPRELVSNSNNALASPFGWHDTNGSVGAEFTVTRGNNVNAYEDGNNQGFQPDGGSSLTFDFPFNPNYSFGDQSESAAITNLFYWNNVIHDIIYQYGFDEASGNFQVNNYGNSGIGNDPVLAEAQDGGGSCNANFSGAPEGLSPVMQMYICNNRDGDFDNGVIIHEYGHGISIRLSGGSNNSNCLLNDEQMGEGWSDWYGAMLTIRDGDTGTDPRPIGNWLFGNEENGAGIRAFPYSTDLAVNPQTYDDIKSTFGPHPLGSVWATMLWEMTWGLIDDHGFDPDFYNGSGGNNIALAIVTEALKLQPCNPGFVDGRDAILAADQALYGGQNFCTIWDAFSKRGLGMSADQGSSNDRTDGTEAFDSPSTQLTTPETIFCVTDSNQNLSGGLPIGGVYSGSGVTDSGDGENYTFSPLEAGIGVHTITYTADSDCSSADQATDTIEVKDENPIIECQNISVVLDEDGTATIMPQDIVTNFEASDGYTLDQSGTFAPENIDDIDTQIFLGDDQVATGLSLGFDFNFYGTDYTAFGISSNGYLTFSEDFDSGCCSGQTLPNSISPNNLIALGWTDLIPRNGGSISYATIGSAPNRILIVQFDNIQNYGDSSKTVTSQIKLFEGSNDIEIHSENVEGNNMTQGIENTDGSMALPVPGRNSETLSLSNDFVSFIPNTGDFPDNCGLETIVTLDITSFDCNDLGENIVTATATDTAGNSASCMAVVTITSEVDVTFSDIDEEFCIDQNPITGLNGGLPVGGVYSGNGVTDDGNGETFTFNPSVAGEGTTTISYNGDNSCSGEGTATIDVEIQSAIPVLDCQDITVTLNSDGLVTINVEDIFGADSIPVDNCVGEPLTFSILPNTFDCDDVGDNMVTVTATDNAGNSQTCTLIVTVEDTAPLQFECINGIELVLDENQTATITEDDVFESLPQDSCDNGYSVSLSQSNFDCDDLGNNSVEEILVNGNFENGLTGWTSTVENGVDDNNPGSCEQAWKPLEDSSTICCCVDDIVPTEGSSASFTSFDGQAGTKYILEQSFIATSGGNAILSFDWVAEFNLNSAGVDRSFEVGIFDTSGNLIETIYTESITAGETTSINSSLSFDVNSLLSLLEGQEVILKFIAKIPETFSGPSKAMLDNVSLIVDSSTIPVEITITDAFGNSNTCIVPVTVTDPSEVCILSTDDRFLENSLSLYPNPADTSFTITWNQDVTVERLEILDMTGKLILQRRINISDRQALVGVSNLSSGVYFVRVSSKNGQSIKKLLVK